MVQVQVSELKLRAAIQSAILRQEDEPNVEGKLGLNEIVVNLGEPPSLIVSSTIQAILQERQRVQQEINTLHDQFPWFGSATSSLTWDGPGYYEHFEQGSIYWLPTFGAHEVHGDIRTKYFSLGANKSYLGYPITNEMTTQTPSGEIRYNNFQDGTILWQGGVGAFIDLTLDPGVERNQLGAWLHISGQGFTSGGQVRFAIADLDGAVGPKSIGSTTAKADGTFADYTWDGTTWPRGGTANLLATDVATGRSIKAPIPAIY